jgi:hypothetical protein
MKCSDIEFFINKLENVWKNRDSKHEKKIHDDATKERMTEKEWTSEIKTKENSIKINIISILSFVELKFDVKIKTMTDLRTLMNEKKSFWW